VCKSTRGTIPACALLELIAHTIHGQHAVQQEVNKQVNQAAEFERPAGVTYGVSHRVTW